MLTCPIVNSGAKDPYEMRWFRVKPEHIHSEELVDENGTAVFDVIQHCTSIGNCYGTSGGFEYKVEEADHMMLPNLTLENSTVYW